MKVYIYCYEPKYQGFHGIYTCGVVDVEDKTEALGYYHDWLEQLVQNYFDYKDYSDTPEDEVTDDELEECFEAAMNNSGGTILEIKQSYWNLSTEMLDELAAKYSPNEFMKKYCGDEYV